MASQHKKMDPFAVEGDFFRIKDLLEPEERQTLERIRSFLADKVEPSAASCGPGRNPPATGGRDP
ncbi:hypothetical protein ACFQ3Z_02940 [Streptomyces nogalater]